MMRHVLAIDQGTTNTKVVLFDEHAAAVAQASRPVAIDFPQAGWVEQDPLAIWSSVEGAIGDCLASAKRADIAAVAGTNQRETVLLWDRSTAVSDDPAIVWQCRRTSALSAPPPARGLEPR